MSQTPRPHVCLIPLLPLLVFLVLLLQVYPSALLAAKNASGWFSPHCDGASFYFICPKLMAYLLGRNSVCGCTITLSLGGIIAHKRFRTTCLRNDARPPENAKQPLTQESGSIRGTQKTNVFQENTMWISADSISKENSSLNIESKIGLANDPTAEALINAVTGN